MDLKDVLLSLQVRLPEEQGFSDDRPEGCLWPKNLAIHTGESVYLIHAFREWIERVPEARDMLGSFGIGWGSGGGNKRQIGDEGVTSEDIVFRARIGERWQNVKLVDVVGHVIKVRVIGAAAGNMTTVQHGQISPVDLARVQEAIKRHPGSTIQTFFDEEEGVIRSTDGMVLTPAPLPPPTEG